MDLKQALKNLQHKDAAAPARTSPSSPLPKAPLIELFHSIQGEGRFVGVPMVFLRVATCPLRCLYCDTPYSYTAAADFVVRSAGERREPNPCTAERAALLVREVLQGSTLQGPPLLS